jgi:cobalt/nickel transport system permease protein
VLRVTGTDGVREPEGEVHRSLADLQKKTAILPNYGIDEENKGEGADKDTSFPGLAGGLLTLLFAAIAWLLLKRRRVRI